MIIVSQDRDLVINFDIAEGIGIGASTENEEKEFEILVNTPSIQYIIGKYATEERAKEVLQEIVKTYVLTEQYKVEDERTRIKLMMEGILLYEMPEN